MRIIKTSDYERWFRKLCDLTAKAKINARIKWIELHGELIGDCKPVGGKVTELRIDFGPGYRVYVTEEGGELLLLLIGGDKSSQQSDIEKAKKLAEEWRFQNGSRG